MWKLSVAGPTVGTLNVCPRVAVSTAAAPPNHDQFAPANGPAVGGDPPVPQPASQFGVPKFVDVCVVHNGHGVPASNVPSAIRSVPGAQLGDGDGDGVPLGDALGDGEGVGVAHEPVEGTYVTLNPDDKPPELHSNWLITVPAAFCR